MSTIIKLTLTRESEFLKNEKAVEMTTDEPLAVEEFMELVEALGVTVKGFSKHELESYILDWAEDIKASREN